MSLLQEIQADAVDAKVDISVILRKCKILAARLGNKEFNLWVEHELNGYTSEENLPEYRILKVESHGNFIGIAWKANDVPIPPSTIPEEYRDMVNTAYFPDAISYYNSLLQTDKDLSQPWPADLVRFVGSKVYKGMNCIDAWKVIPRSYVAAILDTVRNRVLSFVLEIEAEAPDAGEAPLNTKPISDELVNQVFNTYIQGNVTTLTAGSQTITQTTEITVIQNDIESLKQFLKSLGISEPDLKELDEAVHEDAKSKEKSNLGDKVRAWLGKMISKAGSSTWDIATSVAANLLTKALSKYYGFDL